MIDPVTSRKWLYRLMFLALAGGVVFVQLIPLQTTPGNWAMPDLLICLCYAWVLRRPEYMPVILIAIVMLVTDMLFMRPPGLMAALFVLGAEFLRARAALIRELPFLLEWAMVAGVLTAVMVANRVVLIAVMEPRPPLGLSLSQLITTLAAYPLVVLFSRYVAGLRKITPGEVNTLGQHQ